MQSLLTDVRDFVARHRAHGTLTADASEPTPEGYLLTVRCPCGVEFLRWMTPGEAARELVLTAARLGELTEVPSFRPPTLPLWRRLRTTVFLAFDVAVGQALPSEARLYRALEGLEDAIGVDTRRLFFRTRMKTERSSALKCSMRSSIRTRAIGTPGELLNREAHVRALGLRQTLFSEINQKRDPAIHAEPLIDSV